jgi:prevent-host-death family protein
MSHMATIGVRELRRDASRWLARVRAGEAVVVTDRGRPVAKMIPLPEATGFDALVAEGRIAPGPGRPFDEILDQLDSDLPPDQGPSVSEHLAALRDDER